MKLSPSGSFTGRTSSVTGFARKSGDRVMAENIVVDLTTVKTGMSLRDKHTLDYLQAKTYPKAVLVKAIGEKGKGVGRIRIKDIEKDIRGTYKLEGQELAAEFPLKLSDFKIEGIRYMGIGVKDDIVVKVKVPVK
ncbi:MAG: YceI family protein [Bdellovibrionales bacterium]